MRSKTTYCEVCGTELYTGKVAYATTIGSITNQGFVENENEPWETVVCVDCDIKITKEIIKLIAKYQNNGWFEEVCGVCNQIRNVHDDPQTNIGNPGFICFRCQEERNRLESRQNE